MSSSVPPTPTNLRNVESVNKKSKPVVPEQKRSVQQGSNRLTVTIKKDNPIRKSHKALESIRRTYEQFELNRDELD